MLDAVLEDINGSLIVRSGGSELLILPHHVRVLKSLKDTKEFAKYFTYESLVNRPARKLFEAWLRKDGTLWRMIYDKVHVGMDVEPMSKDELSKALAPQPKTISVPKAEKAPEKVKTAKAVTPVKTEKVTEKAKEVKATSKKEEKPVAKTASASKKVDTKAKPAPAKKATSEKKAPAAKSASSSKKASSAKPAAKKASSAKGKTKK